MKQSEPSRPGFTYCMYRFVFVERAMKTLVHIGPAVFSGGFSTFLAFLLLVNSISYGFMLFFRVDIRYFLYFIVYKISV